MKRYLGLMCCMAVNPVLAAEDTIQADRPGYANGSSIVKARHFQIELGVQQERRDNAGVRQQDLFVPTVLRVGVSDRLELRLESNGYAWERVSDAVDTTRTEGMTPLVIGMKYRWRSSDGAKQPALALIARVLPASGTGDFKVTRTGADLLLVSDWAFAPDWTLTPNLGAGYYQDDQGEMFSSGLFAMTLAYDVTDQLNLFVDTSYQAHESRDGDAALIFDAGVAYLPVADIQLDLSAGRGSSGLSPPRPFVSVGISKLF